MKRGIALILIIAATGCDFEYPQATDHSDQQTAICPGATYFYADWAPTPYWAADMRVVCHIGHHIFLAPRARHHRGRVAAKDQP